MRISNTDLAKANVAYNFGEFKEWYIGGAPRDVRERYTIDFPRHHRLLKGIWSTVSHFTESILFPFTGIISPCSHLKDV